MTPRYTIIEKIISILLFGWGLTFLVAAIISYYNFFQLEFKNGMLNWQTVSFFKIFRRYHLIILLSTGTIFAGLSLFLNKKIGWTFALITLLLNAFLFFIPTDKSDEIFYSHFIFQELLFSVVCLTLFFILLLKPFREKYYLTKKTKWTVITITGLILIEKTIFFLTS